MWNIRRKGNEHMPPPLYSGGTDNITLVLYYGGKFISDPSRDYVGGDRIIYDYINIRTDLNSESLIGWCEALEIYGDIRFYTLLRNEFNLLCNDKELLGWARECQRSRQIEIWVETDYELGQADGDLEEGHEVSNGTLKGQKGKGMNVDDVMVESDYEFEPENINEVSLVYVDQNVVEWREGSIDDEDSGDEDLVQHGDDFDERRVYDDETDDNQYSRFNNDLLFKPVFEEGMTFATKDEFKKAVNSHAIVTKRSLYIEKNDKIRVYAKCREDGCCWGLNALKVAGEDTFQIRKYNQNHTCAPSFNVSNVKSTWLGEKYLHNFQNDPKRNVAGWRRDVMKKLNVDISVQQAYRAKGKALETIQGIPELQYAKLWDYANELRNSNPNSTIVLQTDVEGKFDKFYVCFDAIKRGFKHCRKFIGVDGCWLKGPHGGILLSAVGVDPSNALYPIAYAVVAMENREIWGWFLLLLKNA